MDAPKPPSDEGCGMPVAYPAKQEQDVSEADGGSENVTPSHRDKPRRRHFGITPSVTAAPCQLPRGGSLWMTVVNLCVLSLPRMREVSLARSAEDGGSENVNYSHRDKP